jgi:hypothetical protein
LCRCYINYFFFRGSLTLLSSNFLSHLYLISSLLISFSYRNTFIHTSIHPFVHPYIHLSIHPSIHPFIHLPIYPSIHASIHPYIHKYSHKTLHSPTHPSIHSCTHACIDQAPKGSKRLFKLAHKDDLVEFDLIKFQRYYTI